MDKQETPKETFTNDLINLEVTVKPHCHVEFDVEVKAPLLEEAKKEALKSVTKQVSIPGFRKGKAPKDLIQKRFGGDIESKSREFVSQRAFHEAEKLSHRHLLNRDTRIDFKINSFEGNEVKLFYAFETEPLIPDFDYSKFSLESPKEAQLDEKKLEETIHRIRLFFAIWREVQDRGAELGDYVIVDVDIIDDEGKESRAFTGTQLEISKKSMAQWMRDLVIGMKAGETKEGISKPDEDATEEDKKKFEEKKIKVSVKSVEEPVLPAVDDDLAKKVGVDSADNMKERLNYLLKKQVREDIQSELRDQVSEQMLKLYPFDLPKSLVDKEVNYRMSQIESNPSDKARLSKLSAEDLEKEKEKVREQAEKAVKLFFISKKIAKEAKMQLSPHELVADIKTPLDAMFADRDALNPNKTEDQEVMLMSRLMIKKAQDYAVEKTLEKSHKTN